MPRPASRRPSTFQLLGYEEPLPVQLIPQTTWGVNVRTILSEAAWRRLREDAWRRHALPDLGLRSDVPERTWTPCAGCRTSLDADRWHAHEVWEFDEHGVQRLLDIVPVCESCHAVIHIGRAHATGQFPVAVQRLAHVNSFTRDEIETYLGRHFLIWELRSEKPWEVRIDFALERLLDLDADEP